LTVLLSKTTTGEYLGDGPFGAVRAVTLWGLPITVTSVIEAGVALVGCFKTAAQIFRKGGVRVDASNSHQDYVTRNLVAVSSELREALAVYKPPCFGEVTGLN
jgi:HK97 family phage major capsid protein